MHFIKIFQVLPEGAFSPIKAMLRQRPRKFEQYVQAERHLLTNRYIAEQAKKEMNRVCCTAELGVLPSQARIKRNEKVKNVRFDPLLRGRAFRGYGVVS